MSVDQVAHGVRSLARLHSLYWGFSTRTQPKLRWVKTWKPTEGLAGRVEAAHPDGLERAAGRSSDDVSKYDR